MADTDGSSSAARRAQPVGTLDTDPDDGSLKSPSLLARMMGALNANGEEGDQTGTPSAPSHGMINLRRMRVEDVAIPKADIVAVSASVGLEELVKVFKESGLTRLPIYEGTLDTPIGFAHLKDVALTHGFSDTGAAFDFAAILRPLLFVPPSMSIGVLLAKMQTSRRHMALVIDEYGGVDGLVTIEDLIEQVIGEIEDEHDIEDAAYYSKEKAGSYLALAKTPLAEFEAETGCALTDHDDVDEEEIDTLGGLVIMLAGRVPARGEVIQHPSGPEFEVIDADPRRIKRLRVRLSPSPAE